MDRLKTLGQRADWVLAALLAGLADQLFHDGAMGSTAGGFAVALVAAVLVAQPAIRQDRRSRWALALAVGFAVLQFDRPSLLGWLLVASSLSVAVLSPHFAAGVDALHWLKRGAWQFWAGLIAPVRDGVRAISKADPGRLGGLTFLTMAAWPLIGLVVFGALFTVANPVISLALRSMRFGVLDISQLVFLFLSFTGVWMFLRPRILIARDRSAAKAPPFPPGLGVTVPSVIASLLVFNGLFAIENGLDIAYLWSGARLPNGVTLADYAHRGAYPLIVTALLAGLFVLVTLRPGSVTARTGWVRGLVVLWIAQNLLLVISSVQRTLNYVDAYSMTGLRIAALIWMALVGVGLILVCWRLLADHSAGWLINANVLAAAVVLAVCAGIDLDAVAAEWNITHAREVGGGGAPIDLCYLEATGEVGIVALSEFEARPLPPRLHDIIVDVRGAMIGDLKHRQADWRAWTWRGARRLDRALAISPSPVGARLPTTVRNGCFDTVGL